MKKGLAYSIIAVLAVLAIAFAAIHFTNNADKTKQIETLNADVADKAGQIETLNADVADKAGQIETLNADVADKAGQIETLNADVADKAGQIETLNADVAGKAEEIKTLNADVADKVGKIETLNADVAAKTEEIKTLNADVAGKAKQIEALNADIAGKAKEIETLKATVKEKDSQIEALTADVADKAGQIETLTTDVADKAAQIETLTADGKKKDDQIELLKEMVSGSTVSSTQETDNPLVTAPTEAYVIERLSTISDIAKIAAATEDNDPNGQLGKQGGYTAQIYFSSPLVDPSYADNSDLDVIDAGTSCGGSIEVYATIADAERRDRYLSSFDGGAMSSGSHTIVGTMLVRTSSSLSASNQKKLEAEIIEALTAEILLEDNKPLEDNTQPNLEEEVTPRKTEGSIDYAQYSVAELINLCAAIKNELMSRNTFESFDVPVGTWTVGKHLNPGLYSIFPKNKNDSIYGTATLSEFSGTSVRFSSEANSGHLQHIRLENGDTIEIRNHGVSLSPGLPYPQYDGEDYAKSPLSFANHSDADLITAYSEITQMLSKKEIPNIILPGGIWIAGKDFPEGTYDIEAYVDEKIGNYSFYIYADEKSFEQNSSKMSLYGFGQSHETTAANIELPSGSVVFTEGCMARLSVSDENVFFGQ